MSAENTTFVEYTKKEESETPSKEKKCTCCSRREGDCLKKKEEKYEKARLEWNKICEEREAEKFKERKEKGDKQCIYCKRWQSDFPNLPCYGGFSCNCTRPYNRCGRCLNPNHTYY